MNPSLRFAPLDDASMQDKTHDLEFERDLHCESARIRQFFDAACHAPG
jgi:hypothetical protein